jgi:hypothetical protein
MVAIHGLGGTGNVALAFGVASALGGHFRAISLRFRYTDFAQNTLHQQERTHAFSP